MAPGCSVGRARHTVVSQRRSVPDRSASPPSSRASCRTGALGMAERERPRGGRRTRRRRLPWDLRDRRGAMGGPKGARFGFRTDAQHRDDAPAAHRDQRLDRPSHGYARGTWRREGPCRTARALRPVSERGRRDGPTRSWNGHPMDRANDPRRCVRGEELRADTRAHGRPRVRARRLDGREER